MFVPFSFLLRKGHVCWFRQKCVNTWSQWMPLISVCRHLIGFFLFLCLTAYTAVRAPSIMDLYSIQHLHDFVRAADLQKIPKDLMSCLPSLPNVSGLPKLKDITTSLSSGDFISSFSGWNVLEVLNNCLRDRFSYADQTDANVLVKSFSLQLIPTAYSV